MKVKKWLTLICTITCLFTLVRPVSAQENLIEAVDMASENQIVLTTFSTQKEAFTYFETHRQDEGVGNLTLRQNDKILATDQGIVFFQTEACDTNFEYKDVNNNQNGYLNGCYGTDAAYLSTDYQTSKVTFKIAGVVGKGNLSEVTIVPLQQAGNLSSYTIRDGRLYHQIRQSSSSNQYATLVDLSIAPHYLSGVETVYSYDGHYFYQDASLMLQDYQNKSTSHAINPEEPFYFYYQYLNHRSLSQYSVDDLKSYFQETMGIDQSLGSYRDKDRNSVHDILNQSLYYNEEHSFLDYQSLYGSNAMMMLALSMNESGSGRSSLSFTRNNLFGHAAYDSDVEKNAKRYNQVGSSILSHARSYVSASYLNPKKFQYHGGFFGDKAGGMNVSYASDPYWGEKAASYYASLDEAMGQQDFNRYAIGLVTSYQDLSIKKQPSIESEVLYQTGKLAPQSFVILQKVETNQGYWYQVQSEATQNEDFTYSFSSEVGYVPVESFQAIFNPEKIGSVTLQNVTFDAQEGEFTNGQKQIVVSSFDQQVAYAPQPILPSAIFTGWKNEGQTYVAQYRKIEAIQMKQLPKQNYFPDDRIDLKNGQLEVTYQDKKKEVIDLTTSMVSGFDFKTNGVQQVTVSYGGLTTQYDIEVSAQKMEVRDETIERTKVLLASLDRESLNEQELNELITLKMDLDKTEDFYLKNSDLRKLDGLFKDLCAKQQSLLLQSKDSNFSVSGLSLAVAQSKPGTKSFIKDTIKMSWKQADLTQDEKLKTEKIAAGYHAQILATYHLSLKKNFDMISLDKTISVSVSLPVDLQPRQRVTVWRIQDGNVIQLPTQQSQTKLTFQTDQVGSFVITSRQTVNTYQNEDPIETMTKDQNGLDYPNLLIQAIIALVIMLIFVVVVIVMLLRKNNQRRQQIQHRAKKARQIKEKQQ